MAKKVTLHLDALAGIALALIASLGFNLYQRFQYESLLQAHTDLQWHAQNAEVNWKFAKGQLDKCRAAAKAKSTGKN